MSYNRVISSKLIGTLVKAGKDITVSAATRTSGWTRTDDTAAKVGANFITEAQKNPSSIPEGAKEIVIRESEHPSKTDPRPHYTCVVVYDDGQQTTEHIAVE